jgi:hypothetical protein
LTTYAITETVAPKPEFLSMAEAAVLAALADPDLANPSLLKPDASSPLIQKISGTMWSGSDTFPPTFCE